MYSRDHAILSLFVAVGGLAVLDLPLSWPGALVVALVAGVGIDLDHFLIARLTTGEWRALRRCLASPRLVFLDQDEIFEPTALWPPQRLLSHVVLAGVAVPALALIDTALAVFVAAVVYVHLLADLLWDVSRQDTYHRRVREVTGSTDRE